MRPPYSVPADFNPRSPHGERRAVGMAKADAESISTHAPRTGSDGRNDCRQLYQADFNPRSPHGERRGEG